MGNSTRGLNPAEWLEKYGPEFERMKEEIRPCLDGLNGYAATLAAKGDNEAVSKLRRLVDGMSAFWFGNDEDHLSSFDLAVSNARSTGKCDELTQEQRESILEGLETNNKQMYIDLDDEDTYLEYEEFRERLGSEWSPEAQISDIGGMTLD